jgi:hypothetical protein
MANEELQKYQSIVRGFDDVSKSASYGQRARLTNIDTRFGDMSLQIQITHVDVVVANAKR